MPRLSLQIGLIVSLIALIYVHAPHARFLPIDDGSLSYKNPIVTEFDVKAAFSTYDPELYIPLTLLSYQLEYAFFGQDPAIYHITNVVLHIICSILVLLVIRSLCAGWIVPLFTALLFAVHPLNTEAVMWVAGRKDLLCGVFFLGSLLTYIHFHKSLRRLPYYTSVFLFTLALLSKVVAISLPLLLIVVSEYLPKQTKKPHPLALLPFWLLAGVFVIVGMLRKMLSVYALPYIEAALIAIKSTYFYLTKLILPTDLSLFYKQQNPIELLSPEFLVPIIALALLGWITLASRRYGKTFAFSMLWFGITLLPNLANAAKGSEATIFFASDRYAYLPSIGILFLIAYSIKLKQKLIIPIASVIALFALMTHHYTYTWLTPLSYMQRASALAPRTAVAHTLEGLTLLEYDRNEEATKALRKAVDLEPNYAEPHAHLGLALIKMGDIDQGLKVLDTIIERRPDYVYSYVFKGFGYILMNNADAARRQAITALNYEPDNATALQLLATIEHADGNLDASKKFYQKSLSNNPRSVRAKAGLTRVMREIE